MPSFTPPDTRLQVTQASQRPAGSRRCWEGARSGPNVFATRPYLAHASRTKSGGEYFVGVKPRTGLEGHVAAAHYARAEWRIDR